MDNRAKFYDSIDPAPSRSARSSISTATPESTYTNLSFWDPSTTSSTSYSSSNTELRFQRKPSDTNVTVALNGSFVICFTKGSKLFKIKYTNIDVCRDPTGNLRCIELYGGDTTGFVHAFTSVKRPIPHLERPATSTSKSLIVSFLEEQSVQTAQTVFNTSPQYVFEKATDCTKFQEAVLGYSLKFVAGVAEINSARGEETISQNVRVIKSATGSSSLLFFANAQRKEKKRYVTIPIDSVDVAEQKKKAGKPVLLKLSTDNELLKQLKALQILFLEDADTPRFCATLSSAGVNVTVR